VTSSLRRALARLLVPAVLLVLVPTLWAGPASATSAPTERRANYLWAHSNELRRSYGLPSLQPLAPVMSRARALAANLAARRVLQHSDLRQVSPAWTAVGENIGRSSTIQDVTARLFASPHHRENILNGMYTRTGVGTAQAGDGTIYVVQLFWRG